MGFAESFPDQRLRALYSYWLAKRGDRSMPSRADIDPGEFRALLPHILLIDVIDAGDDFRYRLVGTEIERHIGRAVTGRLLSELQSGDYLDYMRSLFLRVTIEGAPVYSENSFDDGRSGFAIIPDFKRTYRLMLPLSRDGTTVDIVLCAQLFEPKRDQDEADVLLVDRG